MNFNHIKLKEVCDMYGFDYQTLLSTKTQGFAKIWINKDTMKTFAFTVKKDDTVRFTDDFAKEISEIKPIEPIKQEILHVKDGDKYNQLIKEIYNRQGAILIFVKTRRNAEKMVKK